MKFIDKISVFIIQQKLIDRFGGIHGLRDAGALESAINAAENRFNYETDDVIKLAATYAYHLSQGTLFSTAIKESRRLSPEFFYK